VLGATDSLSNQGVISYSCDWNQQFTSITQSFDFSIVDRRRPGTQSPGILEHGAK
jgi:hypothetical protein